MENPDLLGQESLSISIIFSHYLPFLSLFSREAVSGDGRSSQGFSGIKQPRGQGPFAGCREEGEGEGLQNPPCQSLHYTLTVFQIKRDFNKKSNGNSLENRIFIQVPCFMTEF